MRIKKSSPTIWVPIIVSLSIIVGFWLGYWGNGSIYNLKMNNGKRENSSFNEMEKLLTVANSSKLIHVLGYIDKMYVENVDIDTLTEEFISKIITKLDPHSLYIPASNVQKANENLEGSFDGVGIVFNMIIDTLVVLEVIAGGPSSKVGLEMGDRIIKIEGENIAGVKYGDHKVVEKLRGPGGTSVNISIERKGVDDLLDISIVRGKVAINSLDASLMIAPKVGYIKLLRFSRTAQKEIRSAIDSLLSLGMESLVFDMTRNTGGYMDQAILVANEFLPSGDMIVYAKGREGRVLVQETSKGRGRFTNKKLYLLVDEFSASASEIVAGAIQDNDRGIVIGRRTFGKGLIQQQIELQDGSMINLTIAKYYTPSGRCIQKPYVMGDSEQYDRDIIDRLNHMELLNADSIVVKDTLKYYTKSRRVVYGGGGIIPDVFVPIDTTRLSNFMRKALISINIIKFATQYATENKNDMSKLNSIEKVKNYLAKNSETIFNKYIDYIIANGVDITRREAARNKNELMPYIEANLGQYTPMRENAFYSIIYPLDNITNQAVELAIKELK